jgi:protein gp37
MDHEWAADLRDRCAGAGVAFYFKQSAAATTEVGQLLEGERYEQYPLEHPSARLVRQLGIWVDAP